MPIYTDAEHRVARLPEGRHRLLHHPDGQLQGRPERPQGRQDGTWTVKAYPSTSVYFISVSMNKPTARRRREPADPRRPQHGGRPRGRQQHRQRGHLDPVGLDRAGHDPRLHAGQQPVSVRPGERAGQARRVHGHAARARSRTGSTRAPATTRSPRPWSPAGRRPCRRSSSSSTASRPTATGRRPARTSSPACCAWAGSPTTRRSTTSSTCSPPRAASTAATAGTATPRWTSSSRRRAAPPTRPQRFNLYNEAEKLILADAPCVPVYTYRDARATNNRIGGFTYNAFALDRHVGGVGQVGPRSVARLWAPE